jgi:hypothetical protein
VDDAREQVRVGAGRHRVEEVTHPALRAVGQAVRRQAPARLRDRRVAVEQHAVQVRRHAQDRREQDAASAADIDEPADAAEVVGGDHVVGLALRARRHRRLQGGLPLRVAAEVLEEALAVHALERCPALANGVEQAGRGP